MRDKESSRGQKFNFNYLTRGRGRSTCRGQISASGQNGTLCSPGAPFNRPQGFGPSSGYIVSTVRPTIRKFSRGYTNKRCLVERKDLEDIDLTKPWITQELRNEIKRKQELLEIWVKTKNDENWAKYKTLRIHIQAVHDKAKTDYLASHPGEVVTSKTISIAAYYCETCDKSFRTEDDLLVHKAEHETCNRDGCEFTAHPKIISKHIKMQHESGLFKRIGNLYTEDEISKWIEERKKRYPTKEVVEAKKVLEQEKLKRGEWIKDDDSRFNKSFSKSKTQRKNSYEQLGNKTLKRKKTRRKDKIVDLIAAVEKEEVGHFRSGVPAFTGIGNNNETQVSVENEPDISDDEWLIECPTSNVVKPLLNNSLGLLAEFYYSDDEEEDAYRVPKNKDEPESTLTDDANAPEEVTTVSEKAPLEKKSEDYRQMKRKFTRKKETRDKKKRNSNGCNFEKKKITLLEKLLKKEIRHERNVILQCIHFIVNQNFFKPF